MNNQENTNYRISQEAIALSNLSIEKAFVTSGTIHELHPKESFVLIGDGEEAQLVDTKTLETLGNVNYFNPTNE